MPDRPQSSTRSWLCWHSRTEIDKQFQVIKRYRKRQFARVRTHRISFGLKRSPFEQVVLYAGRRARKRWLSLTHGSGWRSALLIHHFELILGTNSWIWNEFMNQNRIIERFRNLPFFESVGCLAIWSYMVKYLCFCSIVCFIRFWIDCSRWFSIRLR